jgi:hypothetical protein
MNYEEELKKIQEYKAEQYFKPEAGTHKIVIISEAKPKTYKGDDGERDQIELEIQKEEEMMTWTVTKGLTMKSLYGQLIHLAVKNKGSLIGQTVTLIVKGEGKNKDYTVVEASE